MNPQTRPAEHIIYIEASDVDRASKQIGDEYDGFEVEIRPEKEEVNVDEDCVEDQEDEEYYPCIPGGAPISNPSVSMGCVARVDDSEGYFLSCAHGFYDWCNSSLTGSWFQHDNTLMGQVTDFDRGYDVAVAVQHSNFDFENKVLLSPGSTHSYDAYGHWSDHAIDDMRDNNESIRKYGKRTGFTIGEIDSQYYAFPCDGTTQYGGWNVRTEAESYSGDSGGPAWQYDHSANQIKFIGFNRSMGRNDYPDCEHHHTNHSAAWGIVQQADLDVKLGSPILSC